MTPAYSKAARRTRGSVAAAPVPVPTQVRVAAAAAGERLAALAVARRGEARELEPPALAAAQVAERRDPVGRRDPAEILRAVARRAAAGL